MSILNPQAITPELIDKIKKAHPGKKLFKVGELGVIYTPITRELNDRIFKMSTETLTNTGNFPFKEVEELVVSECVIYPKFTKETLKDLPVGTYTSLNKIIHEKSNFLEVDVFGRPLGRDSFSEPLVDFDVWSEPAETDVEKVKKDHPYAIYKVYIGEYSFIVRQLSRRDAEITETKQDPIFEKVKRVTLFPFEPDWDSIPAGVIDQLYEEVKNLSGYMETRITIEEL